MLVLAPVVPTARQPPGAAGGGLELAEVQLPDLVRPGRVVGERCLASLGKLAAFALVVRGQDQPLVAQEPSHGRLADDDPVVADHGPDTAVAPCRLLHSVEEHPAWTRRAS